MAFSLSSYLGGGGELAQKQKVTTYAITLKDFTKLDFDKVRHLVEAYPHRVNEENLRRLEFLKRAMSKSNGASFRVTKEEFRLLVVIIDITSIGETYREYNGSFLSYDEVHRLFKKLEQKFIRTFKEGVYPN